MMASQIARALSAKREREKTQRIVHGVPPPLAPDVDYRRNLLSLIKGIHDQVEREVYPLIDYYEPSYIQDTPRQDIYAQINYISDQLLKPVEDFANKVSKLFVGDVTKLNKERLQKSFNKTFGFSVPALIRDEGIGDVVDAAITENVKLIKTIPRQYLAGVKQLISLGMTEGKSAVDIRRSLSNDTLIYGISQRRARLIARDQVGKINGNLTEIRAKEVGSPGYIWIGREDDLERPTHVANNNKYFTWSKPPAKTGHPGADYQCRCYPKLIINI